jgi:ABC-type glycerol-3-phosphate transport system substrate-binding protein
MSFKRVLAAALCLGILTIGLSASAHAQRKVTLTWYWFHAAETAQIIDRLAQRYLTPSTGIEIKFVPFGYDQTVNKLLVAAASKEPPDLVYSLPDWAMELYIRGGVVDLKKGYGSSWPDLQRRFYPGALQGLAFRDAQFGLPDNMWGQLTIYRDDVFSKNGWMLPTTWNDLYALLPKMRAQGSGAAYAYDFNTHVEWGLPAQFATFLYQHGGDFWDDSGTKNTWGTEQGVAAFREWTELYTKYNFPFGENAGQVIEQLWRNNELSLAVGHAIYQDALEELLPQGGTQKINFALGHMRGGRLDRSTNLFAWTVYVPSGSKNKEAALKALDWYFSDDINSQIWDGWHQLAPGRRYVTGQVSALKSFFRKYFPSDEKMITDQLSDARMIRPAIGGLISWRYLQDAFNKVTIKKDDPERALRDAVAESQKQMDAKKKEFERFYVVR